MINSSLMDQLVTEHQREISGVRRRRTRAPASSASPASSSAASAPPHLRLRTRLGWTLIDLGVRMATEPRLAAARAPQRWDPAG